MLHAPRSPQSLNNHNFYLFPIGFFVAIVRAVVVVVVATKLNVGKEQNTRIAAAGGEVEGEKGRENGELENRLQPQWRHRYKKVNKNCLIMLSSGF